MSCGVGCRRGSNPVLLWLWRRLVATALIRPLVWEPPYATGVALEKAKKRKKKEKKKRKKKDYAIHSQRLANKNLIGLKLFFIYIYIFFCFGWCFVLLSF